MEIERVTGDHIDVRTLHEVLRLRSEVFVVEQSCHYQDLDGHDLDPSTLHLWIPGDEAGSVAAYLRLLDEGERWRIGRVVTAEPWRGRGLAGRLVLDALGIAGRPVVLSAQSHLTGWYAAFGFRADGAEYLDAGIPHVPMRLDAP